MGNWVQQHGKFTKRFSAQNILNTMPSPPFTKNEILYKTRHSVWDNAAKTRVSIFFSTSFNAGP